MKKLIKFVFLGLVAGVSAKAGAQLWDTKLKGKTESLIGRIKAKFHKRES